MSPQQRNPKHQASRARAANRQSQQPHNREEENEDRLISNRVVSNTTDRRDDITRPPFGHPNLGEAAIEAQAQAGLIHDYADRAVKRGPPHIEHMVDGIFMDPDKDFVRDKNGQMMYTVRMHLVGYPEPLKVKFGPNLPKPKTYYRVHVLSDEKFPYIEVPGGSQFYLYFDVYEQAVDEYRVYRMLWPDDLLDPNSQPEFVFKQTGDVGVQMTNQAPHQNTAGDATLIGVDGQGVVWVYYFTAVQGWEDYGFGTKRDAKLLFGITTTGNESYLYDQPCDHIVGSVFCVDNGPVAFSYFYPSCVDMTPGASGIVGHSELLGGYVGWQFHPQLTNYHSTRPGLQTQISSPDLSVDPPAGWTGQVTFRMVGIPGGGATATVFATIVFQDPAGSDGRSLAIVVPAEDEHGTPTSAAISLRTNPGDRVTSGSHEVAGFPSGIGGNVLVDGNIAGHFDSTPADADGKYVNGVALENYDLSAERVGYWTSPDGGDTWQKRCDPLWAPQIAPPSKTWCDRDGGLHDAQPGEWLFSMEGYYGEVPQNYPMINFGPGTGNVMWTASDGAQHWLMPQFGVAAPYAEWTQCSPPTAATCCWYSEGVGAPVPPVQFVDASELRGELDAGASEAAHIQGGLNVMRKTNQDQLRLLNEGGSMQDIANVGESLLGSLAMGVTDEGEVRGWFQGEPSFDPHHANRVSTLFTGLTGVGDATSYDPEALGGFSLSDGVIDNRFQRSHFMARDRTMDNMLVMTKEGDIYLTQDVGQTWTKAAWTKQMFADIFHNEGSIGWIVEIDE